MADARHWVLGALLGSLVWVSPSAAADAKTGKELHDAVCLNSTVMSFRGVRPPV